MKVLRDPATGTTVFWLNQPRDGKPLERVWRGRDEHGQLETHRNSDSLDGRDRETACLLAMGWQTVDNGSR